MGEKKSIFPAWAIGAFTWFGYHCGSGFASGAQVKAYVLRYGAVGIWAPVIAWVACALFIFIITEYARVIQAKSYRDVAMSIYWPNEKFGKLVILVWDIMVFFSCVVASAACVAGAGALGSSLFGAPYWVGCAVFVAIMVFLLCFGEGALKRLGSISSCMIFLVLFICAAGLFKGFENLNTVFGTPAGIVEGRTLNGALMSGFTYGCIQISFLHTTCLIGGGFKSRSETLKFTLLGFLMNGGVMLAMSLTLFCYWPANLDVAMPVLNVVQNFDGSFGMILLVVYNFVLVMAYLTTAGAVITGQVARYRPIVGKVITNPFVCKTAIVIFFLLASSALSVLGLDGVVTTAYGTLARIRQPIWFFPLIILGPISIAREIRKRSAK